MPSFDTKNFGRIAFEPQDAIEFPRGLPGFEERRRFLAIRQEHNAPLVFLQSLEDPNLCFTTAPVLAVEPRFRLKLSEEDRDAAGLSSVRRPRIGRDVWALAVITLRETGPTVNLLAPLVVNLRSLRAVQAVMRDSAYSHRHALAEPAEAVCS
ncbi:MAG: flagellar assembly protein FliW [Bryobacteraceae bacterium]